MGAVGMSRFDAVAKKSSEHASTVLCKAAEATLVHREKTRLIWVAGTGATKRFEGKSGGSEISPIRLVLVRLKLFDWVIEAVDFLYGFVLDDM
jgi:hypothetical protein